MISNFKELDKLFEEIDNALDKTAHFFVIGGAMLLYHELKEATKDIDIIVDAKQEFLDVQSALKKAGFEARIPTFEYKNIDLNQIFMRADFRIDLFQRTVCKGFCLSEAMKKRALKIAELKHLKVFLCSKEDVFLFKTFTEREGDIEDCLAIAQEGIDWGIILEELKNQIKTSGEHVWITLVGERLDILEARGLEIPVAAELNHLRELYFDDFEKRQKDQS